MANLKTDAIIDFESERVAVIRHDARALPLEDGTVDLVVTSPPYFALRSYRDDDGHYDGQIGSEDTPEAFLEALDECMVEWGRVLKPGGSVWINLGDKYSRGARPRNQPDQFRESDAITYDDIRYVDDTSQENSGVPGKSLMGLPWRFAIRQIDAGWILRAEVIWSKPNGLPESVTDRVRRSHEQWFHFVKEPRYYSAVDEIREPLRADPVVTDRLAQGDVTDYTGGVRFSPGERQWGDAALGRLPGSVWTIPTEPLIVPDDVRDVYDLPDHFAAFPQEWPRRIILGWSPADGTVLDPFGGTGTVAGVAAQLGRFGISNDLSAAYNRLAVWRITESGHFTKSEQRTWAARQESLL